MTQRICLIALLLTARAWANETVTPVFDEGSDKDIKNGTVYHEEKDKEKDKKTAKAMSNKLAKAVAYHVKNLSDPDADIRQESCDMLGALGSPDAVQPLIAVLNPARNERINVMLHAHGALVKITGQNFGYKNYDAWNGWWVKNREEFLKKATTGVDETSKIAAEASNTAGLLLNRKGMYRQAQAQFLDAINRNPTIPDYHSNLGLALFNEGRFLEAMEHFNDTISLDKELPQPYMNIGRCYARMDRAIEAQNWFKQAQEKDKDGKLWDLRWVIGKEYMLRAEYAMAKEYLDQARSKAEKAGHKEAVAMICNDLAITHYGLDQYHSAWRDLQDVKTLGYDPSPEFYQKVRKALVDEGTDPEAEDKAARENTRKNIAEDNGDDAVPATTEEPVKKNKH
jgi:tetratricopeptide (TPR) repeat protein